jgi:hypothetical protein
MDGSFNIRVIFGMDKLTIVGIYHVISRSEVIVNGGTVSMDCNFGIKAISLESYRRCIILSGHEENCGGKLLLVQRKERRKGANIKHRTFIKRSYVESRGH